MKFKSFFKFTLGAVFALPITLLFGSELFANNFSENYQLQVSQEKLLACGGGGGGSSPAAKKAKKTKQAKAKLSFKKRQLAKKAAAGEPTDKIQAEIKELESLLSE